MSEIFEGAVTSRIPVELVRLAGEEGLEVTTAELDGIAIIYRIDPREEFQFSPNFERFVAAISAELGCAVLVRYDSRSSYRATAIFKNGQKQNEYGPNDELFVPLDDEGLPRVDVTPIPQAQLELDEEYETSVNAIQLGVGVLGGPDWDRLRQFIASS